jgi:hypothetical protein
MFSASLRGAWLSSSLLTVVSIPGVRRYKTESGFAH